MKLHNALLLLLLFTSALLGGMRHNEIVIGLSLMTHAACILWFLAEGGKYISFYEEKKKQELDAILREQRKDD